jgi:tRNA modification GTPase
LVGRPNVGKSSLFNYLLAHERAIVTEIAGTTRDTITEVLEIDGVAVALTDTAGLRESTDVVEYMGIERTRRSMFDADVVLLVIDGIEGLSSDETELLMELEGARVIIALNKSDLKTFRDDWPGLEAYKDRVYNVSATKGYGIEELKRAIVGPFQKSNENYLVTNSRHFDLLNRAREAVSASNGLLTARASEELVLVGLYQALALFGELTGETTPDDVLSQIFSTFCIGK